MGRTTCTESQCLYKGAFNLYFTLCFSKFIDVAALVEVLLCVFCHSLETTVSQHFGGRNTFTVFVSFFAAYQKKNRKPKFIDYT